MRVQIQCQEFFTFFQMGAVVNQEIKEKYLKQEDTWFEAPWRKAA